MPYNGKGKPGRPLAERFWEKVDKRGPNGCWLFTGHIGGRGYGTIWVGTKPRTAHQVMWELVRGERPEGMVIDHTCRNRQCVNPDHLRMVTPRQNAIENNDSPHALNAQKTACVRGHPFDAANTRIGPKGHRECRACSAWRQRRWLASNPKPFRD